MNNGSAHGETEGLVEEKTKSAFVLDCCCSRLSIEPTDEILGALWRTEIAETGAQREPQPRSHTA